MSAHGFTADQLAQMVRVGFAAKTSEPVVGSVGQTFEIKRFKITGASERWVINGERVPPTLCHLPGFHGLGDEQIGCDGRLRRELDLRKGEATGLIPP